MGNPGPTHDADSWTFDLDPGGLDPVLGIPRIKDAYERRFPGYPKGITAWPAGAWMAVYGVDLAELFGEVAA